MCLSVPPVRPSAPVNLMLTSSGSTWLYVTWTHRTTQNFTIRFNSTSSNITTRFISDTSYNITNLTPGTRYTVTVMATGYWGMGSMRLVELFDTMNSKSLFVSITQNTVEPLHTQKINQLACRYVVYFSSFP